MQLVKITYQDGKPPLITDLLDDAEIARQRDLGNTVEVLEAVETPEPETPEPTEE